MEPPQTSLFNPQFDGTSFQLSGSSTSILLFHGFTATTLEVRGLAEYIHSRLGYSVSAPLLPGHGTSPQELSRTGYEEWINSAENAYSEVRFNSTRVVVGGESMGGLLALLLAARHPEICCLLVYAPALIIPAMRDARLMQNFIFGSPKKLEDTRPGFLPWQGYRINPLKAVVELGKLQDEVRKTLSRITQPIIIFQGKNDETIDVKSSTIVYQSVSSTIKEVVELENCGHCILLDAQRETIYSRTENFLKVNLPPAKRK